MTRSRLILLAAGGSAALLAGAHVFEALGYAPCKLCLWQRGPHWAAVAIGLAALVAAWRVLPWAGALAAATTGALGIYHTGVERGLWQGPDSCTSGGSLSGSAEDLLNEIMAAPLIRCDEVAWSLFGISMASWNAILSFALVALWVAAARRRQLWRFLPKVSRALRWRLDIAMAIGQVFSYVSSSPVPFVT